jgi:hypothetical protein
LALARVFFRTFGAFLADLAGAAFRFVAMAHPYRIIGGGETYAPDGKCLLQSLAVQVARLAGRRRRSW